MKVTSFVFVICVLASYNALRTASFSGALESIATLPDIDDAPRKITRLTQLNSRVLLQANNTNTTNHTTSNQNQTHHSSSNSTRGSNSTNIHHNTVGNTTRNVSSTNHTTTNTSNTHYNATSSNSTVPKNVTNTNRSSSVIITNTKHSKREVATNNANGINSTNQTSSSYYNVVFGLSIVLLSLLI